MRRFFPYIRYLKAERRTFLPAVVYGVMFGAVNGLGLPLMTKYVFPIVFDSSGGPRLTTWELLSVAAWLPMVFLLRGVCGYLNSYYITLTGTRVLEAIRLDFFRKLQVLPLSFIQGRSAGDLVSRGLADTGQLQNTLITVANDGLKQPLTLFSSIGYLSYLAFTEQGVVLVLVCIALVPLCVFPVRYVGKKVVKRAYQVQAQLGDVSGQITENLSAAREVRAFSLEARATERFAAACRALITSQLKVVKYAQALTPAIEIVSACGISFTLLYAYREGMSIDTFLSIIMALYLSYEPVKKVGAINNELKRGSASLERLEVVLNEPVRIADPATPVEIGRLRGEIAFANVNFAYHTDVPVLQSVTVRIPAGTVCALVGPSGAGKSTFANLVPRFYEAAAGSVSIDGLDVRALRLTDLRRNIALVSQEPVLFNDTIYNNLLLGRPDATREEVIAAAKNAFADDFIRNLAQGYDTMAGERGVLLSGGQKQRIAIARAFLRNAPILILDEATSALDGESEAAIQTALKRLVVGKTVLIIAHRFSTIRDATMILVFDQGRIVAQGDHRQLYAGNDLYRSLYDRQQMSGGLASTAAV
ncbi:MAG: ABC transporter ATP-binding protein [Opitutae bacterium]|nr:ABC transporter ATP-binding protein [Opitutae bacterium]